MLNVINNSREGALRVSAFEGEDTPSKKKVRSTRSPFLASRKPTTEPILKASGEYLSKLSKRQSSKAAQIEKRGQKRPSKTSKASVTPELSIKQAETVDKTPTSTIPKARLKLSPSAASTISPRLQNFHSAKKKSPSISKVKFEKRLSGGGEVKGGPSEFDPTSVLVVKQGKGLRARRTIEGDQVSSRECSRNADSKLLSNA